MYTSSVFLNPHCNTLQHAATHCNTLQHTATHGNILQHTATRCNTPQHAATRRNTLLVAKVCAEAASLVELTHRYSLQHAATRCNTLQHAATRCNTLQHTATHCNTILLAIECAEAASLVELTHRYSLQHTATLLCNTRQLIASHTTTEAASLVELNRHLYGAFGADLSSISLPSR